MLSSLLEEGGMVAGVRFLGGVAAASHDVVANISGIVISIEGETGAALGVELAVMVLFVTMLLEAILVKLGPSSSDNS